VKKKMLAASANHILTTPVSPNPRAAAPVKLTSEAVRVGAPVPVPGANDPSPLIMYPPRASEEVELDFVAAGKVVVLPATTSRLWPAEFVVKATTVAEEPEPKITELPGRMVLPIVT